MLGAWTLVAVIDTTQAAFYMRIHEPHLGWTDAVQRVVPLWAIWALLTPVVFAAAARFPLDRGELRRLLPVHLGVALSIVLVGALAATVVAMALGWPAGEGYSWGTMLQRYLARRLHVA